MTERYLVESTTGLAGRLSHIPYGIGKAEDCGWQSSRDFAQNAPRFKEIGPCRTWIAAPSASAPSSLARTAWQRSRKQEKWLLKQYPEAHFGNQVLHEHLMEANVLDPSQAVFAEAPALLAIGELTDTSQPRRVIGAPLVVIANGEANDTVCLTRPNLVEWKWARDSKIGFQLAERGHEEPTFWSEERAGPIRRIKCIVDSKRYDPTRWLAVQRDSGTRIFRPEYRLVPKATAYHRTGEPSRISANPLFFISKNQTGGNTHSDVAFNTGSRSQPPQLGIIDERGFWSVWDITRAKIKLSGTPKVRLRQCGSLEQGVLQRFPHKSRSELRWHRIFWAGRSLEREANLGAVGFDEGDDDEPSSSTAFPPLERSSTLLLCNSKVVRLLDLDSGSFLPEMSFVRQDSMDCVLDAQANPHDPQYLFVLTTSRLFVARVFSVAGSAWDKPEKRWKILYSSPHFRDVFDRSVRLSVTQGPRSPDATTSLVFVHSAQSRLLDVFAVNVSRSDASSITCHREAVNIGISLRMSPENSIQTLQILPVMVTGVASGHLTESERGFFQQQSRFYQLAALKHDKSLVSTIGAYSAVLTSHIATPGLKVSKPLEPHKERGKYVKYMSARFAIPDDLMVPDAGVSTGFSVSSLPRISYRQPPLRRMLGFVYALLGSKLGNGAQHQESTTAEDIFRSNPFDSVQLAIEEALNFDPLPARTLLQLVRSFTVPDNFEIASAEWGMEMKRLQGIDPRIKTLDLNLSRVYSKAQDEPSLQDVYAYLSHLLARDDLASELKSSGQARSLALFRQMTCNIYLSIYGIGVLGTIPSQPQLSSMSASPTSPHKGHSAEDMHIDSRAESLPSSPLRFRSPGSTAVSQRSNSEEPQEEDDALSLVRAYTSIGRSVPQKKLVLLDKWQLDANLEDYAFDLDHNREETPGMQRRARVIARMNRKRRRAETLLQLSHEPELPSTQPPPDLHFFSSQRPQPFAMSSQSQPIHSDSLQMMSQPITGPFAQRPKKKAKKRKGGF
ncbi:RNA polymerase I-specific transcription initiation factor RRN6-like protein [Xylariaceae sp. FL0016]|nr:RNA polymerase I-specific transcription initiation factor RRN6-like protein [Xylariaceae sp. FL0016]